MPSYWSYIESASIGVHIQESVVSLTVSIAIDAYIATNSWKKNTKHRWDKGRGLELLYLIVTHPRPKRPIMFYFFMAIVLRKCFHSIVCIIAKFFYSMYTE